MSTDSSSSAVPIRATVFVGRWPAVPFEEMPDILPSGTFSPTTATLVTGATEAVLIDALYLKDDVRELGDLIERTGKKLTTIYVTHDHADHYLGIGPLLERFPGAKCVALPHVVESMKVSRQSQIDQWRLLFGDACVAAGPFPEPVKGDTLYVDGSPLKIIEIKQADIHPTSVVHIPEIDTVVAGDSVYNEIHPMLGLSSPSEWQDWLDSIDVIKGLRPKRIVAGHRRPDGDDYAVDTMLAETRAYIKDFAAAFESAKNAEELIGVMTAKYPHHGNAWTLMFSAANVIAMRDMGVSIADSVVQ
ncbi:MBL fold metallo-hydrolase [Streptomyces sp. NPDC005474]|uniref:MBL fold metallo-hydrolase n=1 Tax=Streptomyces sp. NPDC005474 TaxID=3154878 RepID=UPI003455C38D